MTKNMIALHDITDQRIFELNLEDYILTFDDGLFCQYYYWSIFKTVKTHKIFCIAADLISEGNPRQQFSIINPQYPRFLDTFQSLKLYRTSKNRSSYMRVSELKKILPFIEVVAHGFSHHHDYEYHEDEDKMIQDIEKMLEWFQTKLNIQPTTYAYPHYEENTMLKDLLKRYGFINFIGARKQIEDEFQKVGGNIE